MRQAQERGHRERGSAMLLALATTLPLLVAGGTLLVGVMQNRSGGEQALAQCAASDAAASAVHDALARLAADPDWTGTYDLPVGAATAHVVVTSWAQDGVDNDRDGQVDDAGEADLVSIRAEGEINVEYDANGARLDRPTRSARGVTEAIVRRETLQLALEQAFYCHDPEADWNFGGTSFLVSGHDVNPDGTPGPAASIPGIGTPGSTKSIVAQLTSPQQPRVKGSGNWPSVRKVAAVDVAQLLADCSAFATRVFAGPDDTFSGALGDRVNLVPQVTLAQGNLVLTGDVTGCGILLVEGDLHVDGTLDWAGLVVVGGNTSFQGNGAKQDVHGAWVTVAQVAGEDVKLSGEARIQWSSTVLADVARKLTRVALVAWVER